MGTSQVKWDLEQILVDLRAQHLEAVNQLCSSPNRISWRDIWAGHFHGYTGAAQIHLSMYIHEQFLHCSWGPPFLSWWKEPQTPLLLYAWGSQVVLTLLISTLHFVHPLLSPQQGLVANSGGCDPTLYSKGEWALSNHTLHSLRFLHMSVHSNIWARCIKSYLSDPWSYTHSFPPFIVKRSPTFLCSSRSITSAELITTIPASYSLGTRSPKFPGCSHNS